MSHQREDWRQTFGLRPDVEDAAVALRVGGHEEVPLDGVEGCHSGRHPFVDLEIADALLTAHASVNLEEEIK